MPKEIKIEKTSTQVQTPELTPEEIQEKMQAIRSAVAAFNTDPRHERYKLSEANRSAIGSYLKEHDLDTTEETLHLAYAQLAKENKLDLYEESKLSAAEPPKEAPKDDLPPIGKATADDLGVGFAAQQRARKQVEPGSGPSSNRDAFVRAAQKASANPKISGGRFHL